jgi:formyltetrahydrofolate synthetase
VALGEAVAAACEKNAAAADFKMLYPESLSIKEKIEKVAKAGGVLKTSTLGPE